MIDVTFCLLEQIIPDQADNPFTVTMVKHFDKLGTPLRSVFEYPNFHAQLQRFNRAGFPNMEFQNLWELWSDSRFLSPSQRMVLDDIEPFDEWEEFALFASHYCLIVAHNSAEPGLQERRRGRRDSLESSLSDMSARTSSPHKTANEWFAYRYYQDSTDLCQRHHGTSYFIPGQDAIAVHGGVGPRTRLATTAVCRPKQADGEPPVVPPIEVGARSCHSCTTLGNEDNLLVGGRAAPHQAMRDCWLQRGDTWTRVHDLPEPRYRHRCVKVNLPNDEHGVILFGGKTDARMVVADTLLWSPSQGWTVLKMVGSIPVPRFGQTFVGLGYNHGLMFGGMRQDGVICQGLWRWRLVVRDNKVVGVSFWESKALDATVGAYPWFARFGASYGMLRDELLIVGGISRSGCIPKLYEIQSVLGSFSNFKEHDSEEMSLRLYCTNPHRPSNCPRPFLIGHSTHRTRNGLSVIIGGGATCFSFGNYYNTGVWILHDRESGMSVDWVITPSRTAALQPQVLDHGKASKAEQRRADQSIEPVSLPSSAKFLSAAHASAPLLMSKLDFGSCVTKWSLDYLRSTVPQDRSVIVHESSTRSMNFVKKDFKYTNSSFDSFLDTLQQPSSHLYLRALASSNPAQQPANLELDWPELSPDFSIPPELSSIVPQIHSSVLRVSNDINMWLHYDVMANVLFQIRGVKKLCLFPPSDLHKLCFPSGSTTSELSVFNNDSAEPGNITQLPDGTSPHIAILKPGDALFIPPLWAHTGISLRNERDSIDHPADSTSLPSPVSNTKSTNSNTSQLEKANPYLNIAVNTFFRNLPGKAYAAGRDVYGNRDLAAYEEGRRDLEKIINRFKGNTKGGKSKNERRPRDAIDRVNGDDKGNAHHDVEVQSDQQVDGRSEPAREVQPSNGVVLENIDREVSRAYLLRLARELEEKAAAL